MILHVIYYRVKNNNIIIKCHFAYRAKRNLEEF